MKVIIREEMVCASLAIWFMSGLEAAIISLILWIIGYGLLYKEPEIIKKDN